jgi:hypothetical protein
MDVRESSVRSFASEWDRVRPTLLFGHAHSIYLLARYVAELGLTAIRPRSIVSSSMMLLDAERSEVPGGWPRGGQTRLALPNNHLQYAITWFVLAFCIAVIFVFYVRSRRREGRP